MEFIGTCLTGVIGWVGDVATALFTTEGALHELLPLFGVGIAVSAMFAGIKGIRSLIWGA